MFIITNTKFYQLNWLWILFFTITNAFAQQSIKLSDQVVTATRIKASIAKQLAEVTVINEDEIINSRANTISELISTKTGIEFTSNGGQGSSANVYIRGSKYNHVLVLIDGIRVGSLTLGSAQWSNMVLANIDRIEIMRGPASSLYGSDAIGGVVQIFTKDPKLTGNNLFAQMGIGSFNSFTADLGINGMYKFKDGQAIKYALSLGYQKSHEFNATADNPEITNNNHDQDGYSYNRASYRLAYLFSPKNEIGISSTNVYHKNHYDSSPTRTTPFSQDWQKDFLQKDRQQTQSIYLKNQITNFWDIKAQLGRSINYSDQYEDKEFKNFYHSQQDQWQIQNEFNLPLGKLLAVYEKLNQKVRSNVDYDETKRKINSWQLGWLADFHKHNWQINFRDDHNTQFGNAKTMFAGYGYQFNKKLRAYASTASGFKAPTINDLYYPNSGNKNLKPERSNNYEVGLEYRNKFLNFSTNFFENNIKQMIIWEDDGSGNWKPANTEKVRIKGVSLNSQYNFSDNKSNIGLNFTYQQPQNLTNNLRLNHRANYYGSLRFNHIRNKFTWGIEGVFRGDRFADAEQDIKLSEYALANFRLKYNLNNHVNILFNVNNLFDTNYYLVRDYQTGGRRFYLGFRVEQ